VSNRGVTRIDQKSIKHQQLEADITTLVYKGIRLVSHNQRPNVPHNNSADGSVKINHPMYDIPTIAGRIFNGASFEPVTGIDVSLYCQGELVAMRNYNWQNPFSILSATPGAFTFWPAPIDANTLDTTEEFKFTVKVKSPDFEPLNHFFSITATSKFHSPHSFTLNRTFKLPDLYLFPPGSNEDNE
jgi:competence protein ComFB